LRSCRNRRPDCRWPHGRRGGDPESYRQRNPYRVAGRLLIVAYPAQRFLGKAHHRARRDPGGGCLPGPPWQDTVGLCVEPHHNGSAPRLLFVRRRHRTKIPLCDVVMGRGRHARGVDHRPAARQSRVQPGTVSVLRTSPAAPHQRGDLRLRRQRGLHRRLLLEPTPAQSTDVLGCPEPFPLLGVAGDHRGGGTDVAPRLHTSQGVRGTRMADRHRHRGGLGRVRDQLLRHARQAARTPPLRRDLVLHRDHHHGGGAAHLQQPQRCR